MNFLSAYSPDNSVTTISIPKSALGYATNNVYSAFPPLMADGRSLVATDQNETIINGSLLKTSGVKSNWDYRNFLTQNSEQIYSANKTNAFNDVGYYERLYGNPNTGSKNNGYSVVPAAGGDAQKRRVEGDLKHNYLTREELNSRIYAPNALV